MTQSPNPTITPSPSLPIDAGLLGVFRIAVWIRLAFTVLVIVLLATLQATHVGLALVILVESMLLLAALGWTPVQRRLGGAFLPVMLTWALFSPLVGRALLLGSDWPRRGATNLPEWLAGSSATTSSRWRASIWRGWRCRWCWRRGSMAGTGFGLPCRW